MKVGILGAGNVGSRLAALARSAGHDVVVGSRSGASTLDDAIEHGDIVIVAIHYSAAREVLGRFRDRLSGEIVVDATNPLNEDWSPLDLGHSTSAAEQIAKQLPGTKVVKAFNTVFADTMTPEGLVRNGQSVTTFVASNDRGAAALVAELAESLGFSAIVSSRLLHARYLEAMAHLNIAIAVGEGGGTNSAFVYHRA